MTTRLYTTRVSFDVTVEASNPVDANTLVRLLTNEVGTAVDNVAIAWDNLDWVEPEHLCPDCGGIGDDGVCPETPMLCDVCCDHDHDGSINN